MPVAPHHFVGPQEDAAEAQFFDTAACFRHRVLHVERRDHAGADEPVGVFLNEGTAPYHTAGRYLCNTLGWLKVSGLYRWNGT